ncbi:MAG TPA: F0F1 ATP synthase subunit B' [Roseibacterium sp.]|nr:F0F1 ATP synthase subunit B' [Roseibacterium sp.]
MATDTQDAGQAVAEVAVKAPAMPQLDFTSFPNQIAWLVFTLVVIYLILSKVALPRIGGILAERQGTITNDISAAEDLKARALEAEEVYNKALADARAEALNIAVEMRAEIQGELNDAIAHADAEISAKAAESEKAIGEIRASALEAVEAVAKDTAAEIVSALGGKADAKAVALAVTSGMKG